MKLWIYAIIALAGIGGAQAASLKDPVGRSPVTVSVPGSSTWSGLWAAALAGYSMSNTELDFSVFNPEDSREIANVDGFGGEGWSGDVQLGGDVQIGRFVVGAFGEYSFGGTESQVRVFDGIGRLDVEQKDSYSILARAGVVTSDNNTLLYVASGYTWTEAEATLRFHDESVKRSYDFGGVPLELGVEHKFGPNVRGRLAGRYTWFGKETVFEDEDEGSGARLTAEPGVFAVKAGVVISTSGGLPTLD